MPNTKKFLGLKNLKKELTVAPKVCPGYGVDDPEEFELYRENNGEFSKTELIERAKNMENIPEDYTNEMIEQMKKDGVLYNPSRDTLNKP